MKRATDRLFERRRRGGFTLTEILIVIVIIGLLAALLLPAIGAAVRNAREASVDAEINQMAQALADFKSKYGDYPPSRFLAVENGNYSPYIASNTAITWPTPQGGTAIADISMGQLAQRSVQAIRKFWPRVAISTTGTALPNISATFFYDFNGNGTLDATPYILDGRECLTFFLGGIPQYDGLGLTPSNFKSGMTGFSRNPLNPFMNSIIPSATANPMYSNNRTQPMFEFKGDRLAMLPEEISGTRPPTGIPGYFDTNSSVSSPSFYAYFSAYNGSYDPNDVNAYEPGSTTLEMDVNGLPLQLPYPVTFPVVGSGGTANQTASSPPNPYTTTLLTTATLANAPMTYLNPQTFQIISPGVDAHYGAGGQYLPSQTPALPTPVTGQAGAYDRTTEKDNLSNFHNGRLD